MFTVAIAVILSLTPKSYTLPARHFDWNEFHYVETKPVPKSTAKPKFIRPIYIPDAAKVKRPIYTAAPLITSDSITIDCGPQFN